MSRRLFLKIVKGISTYEADPLAKHFKFFKVRADCTGRMSLSVIMKCTAAIRQLAYGTTPNAFDKYLQMSERTVRDCLLNFNMCIIDLYMSKYLRKPTLEDVEKYIINIIRVMVFRACLEALIVCTGSGANNDINVLDNSLSFDDLLDDKAHVAPFVVNGVGFEKGYYLADGIYPQWTTFVKSFTVENDVKHSYIKKRQETTRKDVECAFGVLQGQDQNMAVTDWNEMYANPSRNMQRTWVERSETVTPPDGALDGIRVRGRGDVEGGEDGGVLMGGCDGGSEGDGVVVVVVVVVTWL
ncbi:reverse transcriptase domain-containing protein [Tanacetum coccineum]